MIEKPWGCRDIRPLVCIVAALACACGGAEKRAEAPASEGGGVVQPKNPTERQVLELLETLPAGKPRRVGGVVVVADPPYYAASGRLCRGVTVTPSGGKQSAQRLACREGEKWVYVPTVMIAPAGARD